MNLHLIRDSEIVSKVVVREALSSGYDSHKLILSIDNEMLIFHQLYDLYELHHWQDPLSVLV